MHYVGLGNQDGVLDFYVPVIDGWHATGEASFDLHHFEDAFVSSRLSSYSASGEWSLSHVKLPVTRFDDFGPVRSILSELDEKSNVFVKMDVEGTEEAALKGMQDFLATYRPTLMVENTPEDGVADYLRGLGYGLYVFDPARRRLAPATSRAGFLNSFYLHRTVLQSGRYGDGLLTD